MPILLEILKIHDLYYVQTEPKSDGKLKAVINSDFEGDASDIQNLMTEDLFSENTLDNVKINSPHLYKTLIKNGFESAMIVRVRKGDTILGYLVYAVNRSLRIWQENKCAILYYVAGLLALSLD